MDFLCICLSPAIDATVRLGAWPTDGCILKDAAETLAPGGKAVNVARWLAKRANAAANGAKIACGGLLGEDNAAVFARELSRYGIDDRFIRVPGTTRVNEMFVTPSGCFKVNRPAFPGLTASAVPGGTESFAAGPADVVVLSGSLPRDFPSDTYRRLVAAAKDAGATVVLDASGPALAEGAKARPDVIKPNADECRALVGFVPKTPDEFARATAALKAFCDCPIISDGASGCWFDGTFVPAPPVETLDTTAAGDTLLAEWCWRRYGLADADGAGRWAVAAGSAACTMPGGEPPPFGLVEELAARPH